MAELINGFECPVCGKELKIGPYFMGYTPYCSDPKCKYNEPLLASTTAKIHKLNAPQTAISDGSVPSVKSDMSDPSVKFTPEVCREMYDALDECSCALEDVILHIMSGKGFDTVSSDNIIYVLQEAAEKAEQALKKARGEQ